jgi:NADH dehydrogenase
MNKKKIVLIGGGFGGLALAKGLRNAAVDITLIDRSNHHLFQPLLYQVAFGALSPADVATPLRQIFSQQKNISIMMDEVVAVERAERQVRLASGDTVAYDQLVIAVGNQPSYFGHADWASIAPGLKELTDAFEIRDKLYRSFEQASRLTHPADRAPFLRFVFVGAGATGVELAGSFAEIALRTLRADFRNLGPDEVNVLLIEGGDRILPSMPPELSRAALADLERMGVQVRLNTKVTSVTDEGVQLNEAWVPTHNVIWAAGNEGAPVLRTLDTPTDRSGRILIEADLSLPSDPDVYVIGDAAAFLTPDGQALPGVSQVAMQQGSYLAKLLPQDLPKTKRPPFTYFDKGMMATVGRASAVANVFGLNFTGLIAWLLWCFIHVVYLIEFRSRLRVMIEWIWYYITFRPGVRLLYRTQSTKPVRVA